MINIHRYVCKGAEEPGLYTCLFLPNVVKLHTVEGEYQFMRCSQSYRVLEQIDDSWDCLGARSHSPTRINDKKGILRNTWA